MRDGYPWGRTSVLQVGGSGTGFRDGYSGRLIAETFLLTWRRGWPKIDASPGSRPSQRAIYAACVKAGLSHPEDCYAARHIH
jgi:hypothetical protein